MENTSGSYNENAVGGGYRAVRQCDESRLLFEERSLRNSTCRIYEVNDPQNTTYVDGDRRVSSTCGDEDFGE